MDRDNFAKTAVTILCAMLFIVIGSCFSAFLYKNEVVKILDPNILRASDIRVFNKSGDKEIDKLNLPEMKLGLKPATGEEDVETGIPSTVHDKKGSEGVYGTFRLYAPSGANIYITNITVKCKHGDDIAKSERENIKVSVSKIKDSTTSLKEDKVFLGSAPASEERVEYTLYVWLTSKISEDFDSSTISFDLSFENL